MKKMNLISGALPQVVTLGADDRARQSTINFVANHYSKDQFLEFNRTWNKCGDSCRLSEYYTSSPSWKS